MNSTGTYVGYGWGVDGLAAAYLAAAQKLTLKVVAIKSSQQGSFFRINNSGVTVGFYVDSSGTTHGMMVSGSTVTNIDDPNAVKSTICRGVNSSNQVVGDYYDSTDSPHGFLYSSGTSPTLRGRTESSARPRGSTITETWLVTTTVRRMETSGASS